MALQLDTLLPAIDTAFIVISGLFMLLGVYFIRRKMVLHHHRSMLVATAFAASFLLLYVVRALLFEARQFQGDGIARAVYFAVLISHMVLATLVGPLVLATLGLALRGHFPGHRRVARFTVPMWLYVVASGWTVYVMLYHIG